MSALSAIIGGAVVPHLLGNAVYDQASRAANGAVILTNPTGESGEDLMMDLHELDPAVLVCFSAGGYPGLQHAMTHPGVGRLILVGCPVAARGRAWQAAERYIELVPGYPVHAEFLDTVEPWLQQGTDLDVCCIYGWGDFLMVPSRSPHIEGARNYNLGFRNHALEPRNKRILNLIHELVAEPLPVRTVAVPLLAA